MAIRVFVTYAWDTPAHQEKVFSFVERLRIEGFEARVDKMITQEHTAPDFNEMMVKEFTQADKVLIILSKGYKEKAEGFLGGVGKEFRMVMTEIEREPRKYILGSFDGRGSEVSPLPLGGREIVNLNSPAEFERLLHKLMDTPELMFSPVAASVPILQTKTISAFVPNTAGTPALVIKDLTADMGTIGTAAQQITRASFNLTAKIANIGETSIKDFSVEIHVPRKLVSDDALNSRIEDDRVVFEFNPGKTLFKNQLYPTPPVKLEFAHWRLGGVFDQQIAVKVFSDSESLEKSFPVEEIFKIRPAYGGEPQLLRPEMFQRP
jgi:SEFIR domain